MYAYFQMNIFVFNGQLNQPNNNQSVDRLLCVLSVAGDGRLLVHIVLLFIKTPFSSIFIIIYILKSLVNSIFCAVCTYFSFIWNVHLIKMNNKL